MHIPQSNDQTIFMIIHWASARDAVRAVLLTSTRAIPDANVDALSDYDVILIVDDIHPFVDDHSWLDDFGDVLVAYWDPVHPDQATDIDICANVIQYRHGLKIDFTLWPVSLFQQVIAASSLPAELDAGYLMLLDKDHLAVAMPIPTGRAYVSKPPSLAGYHLLINDFLSDAPYVAKCLWRDELLPAKWCLDYDMKHVYLRKVLEWRAEIDHGWSMPVGDLGRGLKQLLPLDIWSALENTYVGVDLADNWESLINTMELFRLVSIQVGDYFGYTYPEDLHARVTAYVNHISHLGSPTF
jgi:aminoglycoside 6-adenylyltransferase